MNKAKEGAEMESLQHHSCELRQQIQRRSRPLTDRLLPNEVLTPARPNPLTAALSILLSALFISLFSVSPLTQPTQQHIYDTTLQHPFFVSLFIFPSLPPSHPVLLHPKGLRNVDNRLPHSFFTLPLTRNCDTGKIMRN